MATQINRVSSHSFGGLHLHEVDLTLITSGTTVTYTFPVGATALNIFVHNVTSNEIDTHAAAATEIGNYTQSTGVWVSAALTVNDNIIVTFLTY